MANPPKRLPESLPPDSEEQSPDYEVGYGKPPAHTQFKKGKSGNPRGRPKGSISLAKRMQQELGEKVTISENGRQRTVTKFVAASKQIINRAVQGDAVYMRMLLPFLHTLEASAAAQAGKNAPDLTDAALLAPLLDQLGRGSHQVLSPPSPKDPTPSDSDEATGNGASTDQKIPKNPKNPKSES